MFSVVVVFGTGDERKRERGQSVTQESTLLETTKSFTMYTTPWCGYCHRLKSQLDREGITYDVVDIERDPSAVAIVMAANNGNQTVPTLVFSDGTATTNPSLAQVKGKIAAL